MTNTAHTKYLKQRYQGKSVIITGGFGFKGSWLAVLLRALGANVTIMGLQKDTDVLSTILDHDLLSIIPKHVDVRSHELQEDFTRIQPDYVFHLAAQPIVLEGYKNPLETFSTNVMGTANVLEAVRQLEKPVSVVNVTTDKVYRDVQKTEGYVESDELRGLDPYSSSKSCSELVTFSYRTSYFAGTDIAVSTCRAGNVIGGGDFSANRIVPDLVVGRTNGASVPIRNFKSIRPYEHVLDALHAYVILAARQSEDASLAGEYNVGPNDDSLMTTQEIVQYAVANTGVAIEDHSDPRAPHETAVLKLDSSLFRDTFDWTPKYASKEQILRETFSWYGDHRDGADPTAITLEQVRSFLND